MKRIQHPSMGQLGLFLVPIVIVFIVAIIKDIYVFPFWITIICLILFAAFIIPFTYQCIKQKCYLQLLYAYLLFIAWGASYWYGWHFLTNS